MKKANQKSKSSGSNSTIFVASLALIVVLWLGVILYSIKFGKLNINFVANSLKGKLEAPLKPLPPIQIPESPNVQTQRQTSFQPKTNLRAGSTEPDHMVHIVFSTDCSFFQDWQSLLVFHSAMVVGQVGPITRIASGCTQEQQDKLTTLYKKLFPQYHVHFTPDFKADPKTGKKYDFYNKPYGLKHWLETTTYDLKDGNVIALIDPDMILLRPITTEILGKSSNLFLDAQKTRPFPIHEHVSKGYPVAQLYGLGAPWTNDHSKNFNRTHVCGEHSPCMKVTQEFGEDHFSVGPPYLVEHSDMIRLTGAWTDMVPRVYEKYPALLAEMYAYSMGAAHADLPHLTLRNMMVSNTEASDEGWEFVDSLQDDVCAPPTPIQYSAAGEPLGPEAGIYFQGRDLPTVLHFCQFFRVGEIGFQKRRFRKEQLDCDFPLMIDLPRNLSLTRYKNRDGEIIPIGQRYARRNAFMLCQLHRAVNAMLTFYKERMCPEKNYSREKSTNLITLKY